MTTETPSGSVSPLRARMIEDMRVRAFLKETQRQYLRHVATFAEFLGRPPDTATVEDVRRFQIHQVESGCAKPSVNASVTALRFFFTVVRPSKPIESGPLQVLRTASCHFSSRSPESPPG